MSAYRVTTMAEHDGRPFGKRQFDFDREIERWERNIRIAQRTMAGLRAVVGILGLLLVGYIIVTIAAVAR